MINPFLDINWRPDRRDLREFGRTLVIGGVILFLIACGVRCTIDSLQSAARFLQMIFSVIVILGVVSWILPPIAKPVYLIWFFVGACMGTVISNLLFLIFFYLFFTPIACVVRQGGRDPLRLKSSEVNSMWEARTAKRDVKRYYRQY